MTDFGIVSLRKTATNALFMQEEGCTEPTLEKTDDCTPVDFVATELLICTSHVATQNKAIFSNLPCS